LTIIQFGTFEERLKARENFRGLLPVNFSDTTLIGDKTHFPVNATIHDEYKGPNSIWSYKLHKPGFIFLL
jgi:hypothetical protein